MTPEEIERVKVTVRDEWGSRLCSWIDDARRCCSNLLDMPCRCESVGVAVAAAVEQILRDRPLPDDLGELTRMRDHMAFERQRVDEKIEHVELAARLERDADARREKQ
jgi:hypothetical protein